jgi:hypothetical protein
MIVGFGTRKVTDEAIKPFVENEGGIFYMPSTNMVDKFEQAVWPKFNTTSFKLNKPDVAVFGILRGTERKIYDCRRLGLNYYYFDHAYFFSGHKPHEHTNFRGYRITKNGEAQTKILKLTLPDTHRIQKYKQPHLKEHIKFTDGVPGNKIVIIPPTEAVARFYKFDVNNWIDDKIKEVRKYTDKQFIIRLKTSTHPLEEDLQKAFAVVTYQSTVGIKSVMRGIRTICDDVSMCKPVSIKIENIEKDYIRDRDKEQAWIDSLLASQFTMQEITNGIAKQAIDRLYDYNT